MSSSVNLSTKRPRRQKHERYSKNRTVTRQKTQSLEFNCAVEQQRDASHRGMDLQRSVCLSGEFNTQIDGHPLMYSRQHTFSCRHLNSRRTTPPRNPVLQTSRSMHSRSAVPRRTTPFPDLHGRAVNGRVPSSAPAVPASNVDIGHQTPSRLRQDSDERQRPYPSLPAANNYVPEEDPFTYSGPVFTGIEALLSRLGLNIRDVFDLSS
jgi:hypothetical protein